MLDKDGIPIDDEDITPEQDVLARGGIKVGSNVVDLVHTNRANTNCLDSFLRRL